MTALWLPDENGGSVHTLGAPADWTPPPSPPKSRVVYAAAHVVADPLGDNTPGAPAVVDWDTTLDFRRHLWRQGLGVADAMDTAQRGMGLDWAATAELIRRSAAEARACGGTVAVGVGTDHLPSGPQSLDRIAEAYLEQLAVAEDAGAGVILMASRALAATAQGADDYLDVYRRVIGQCGGKVILHWLGEAFDPALRGYWGSTDIGAATATFLDLIKENSGRVDGVKVSLLDAGHEIALRRSLPEGVRLYTGDDFNYPELIRGDELGHSDALLGIFAGIAPVAARALQALDQGDLSRYDALLAPTVPLSRHVFAAPTPYYKTGIAFLAWIAGLQPAFVMVGGLQSGRSILHLARTFRLADSAGLLPDPDLAATRMRSLLETAGLAR
ncbi:dihydrodipicolinate synthase family protein [Actinocorallia populi]|uniref:dihydrodipicolinate synthase family protein n=1 Tax=Actinocorallia populi TaxID=2079200 RepID=UPI000D095ECA|nr:dihydrodipicolinate synthase family protein [Actinocorallia populi]